MDIISVPIEYAWNKNGAEVLFFATKQLENADNYYDSFEIAFDINRSNEIIIVEADSINKLLLIKNKPKSKLKNMIENYRTNNYLLFVKSEQEQPINLILECFNMKVNQNDAPCVLSLFATCCNGQSLLNDYNYSPMRIFTHICLWHNCFKLIL